MERIDKTLNTKPKEPEPVGKRPGSSDLLPDLPQARPIPFDQINKPFKKIMAEQKYAFLTSDPENMNGHDLIR